jgi:hypothetical protein
VKLASSDPARASIDSSGLATGIAYGTVTISGTYECCTAKTSLSVGNQAVAISSIAVTQQNPTITVGHTQQFVAIASYSNDTHSVITNSAQWTSSDNTMATVGARRRGNRSDFGQRYNQRYFRLLSAVPRL